MSLQKYRFICVFSIIISYIYIYYVYIDFSKCEGEGVRALVDIRLIVYACTSRSESINELSPGSPIRRDCKNTGLYMCRYTMHTFACKVKIFSEQVA